MSRGAYLARKAKARQQKSKRTKSRAAQRIRGTDSKSIVKKQSNKLEKEFKTASDDRKKEIVKDLKKVRSIENKLNKQQAVMDLRKATAGLGNQGLVARTSDGTIITDSSGNPIMTSAGRNVFDQTRQKYSDRSENLRQTNPELYDKMYPVAGAAMNILPKLAKLAVPGGSIISGIGSALKNRASKIKTGVGSIFDKFQNNLGTTSRRIIESGGEGEGQAKTPQRGLPQAESAWAGIYNRLINEMGMTPEQAKQRMAEIEQSGTIGTFGPIPEEFRIKNIFQASQGVIGGIPGVSQPISMGRPGPVMPNMVNPGGMQKMQPPITAQLLSGQANTPANALAAFNQMQPMSTQQLSFGVPQQPQGLAQFSSMLNRFS